MITINEHYLKLQASYLFSDIARRVAAFQEKNPDIEIIKLGIGDVTRPLPRACIDAFHRAVDEMASEASFRGYGPEQGYAFLREAIAKHDFQARGADIQADEIFVSDGAKCDTGNIQELFSQDIKIAIPDPVYPVYLDTNVMAGRTGGYVDGRYQGIVYLDSTRENNFVPALPRDKVDLIYLCFPNNPTGSTISTAELKTWVDYAREHKALILFDAAYEIFIRDHSLPHSIYEIEGAKEVAIELQELQQERRLYRHPLRLHGDPEGVHGLRRQRGATPPAPLVEPPSLHQIQRRVLSGPAGSRGRVQRGGQGADQGPGRLLSAQRRQCPPGNAGPGLLVRRRRKLTLRLDRRWPRFLGFFRHAAEQGRGRLYPGAGFGRCGNGYIRISAFNSHENVEKAMQRIKGALS